MDGSLLKIINTHIEKYPLMEPQDLYKLVYQHEFGCAHAVTDRERARNWLLNEYRSVTQTGGPLYEDIGGGFVRVQLRTLDANGVSLERLLDWFIKSAAPAGNLEKFALILRELPLCGLPFDTDALNVFFESMEAEGFPAVHHSETYRRAYAPAYRVVKRGC